LHAHFVITDMLRYVANHRSDTELLWYMYR